MTFPIVPNDVKMIIDTLNNNGYECYIVGGSVRDALMGLEPHDWDITTSALPDEVKGIFSHTVDTGIKHGTVTVVMNKVNYEITTYRIEGEYEDCRHPSTVSFTRNLHEDLLRRDFTVNAIAYHPKEGCVDIFGGVKDINDKVLRGVGVPKERFQEDALRMLRAVRFSAQLGFEIEEETFRALKDNVQLLKNISAERIREELSRILCGKHIEKAKLLWDSGLLEQVSGQLYKDVLANEEEIVFELLNIPKQVSIAYSVILQCSSKEIQRKVIKFLKFDTKTKRLIEGILKNLGLKVEIDETNIRRLMAEIGIEALRGVLEIKKAGGEKASAQALTVMDFVLEKKQCISINQLEINGEDLIKLGFERGKEIGAMLNYALSLVLENPDWNNKKSLETEILKRYKKQNS